MEREPNAPVEEVKKETELKRASTLQTPSTSPSKKGKGALSKKKGGKTAA